MNLGSWLLWGFVATVVLTAIMVGCQSARLTRISLPYLLGTMVTAHRDRANVIGAVVHMANGWLFSLVYVAAFHAWGGASWIRGAAIGLVHAGFVSTALMQLLPAFHPRMATEEQSPSKLAVLEPPGAFALHYGVKTPIAIVVAHLAYGAILGAFYSL